MSWEDKFKSNLLEVLYRADQPRDELGRFASTGGGGAGGDSKVYDWALNKFGDAETAKNFTEWFGDSKVVDGDGNPLVTYHGTGADFGEFDMRLGDLGAHFAELPEVASSVAATMDYGAGKPNVMPAYLAIENPIRLQDPGVWDASAILPQLRDSGAITQGDIDSYWENHPKSGKIGGSAEYLRGFMEGKGYDGVVYLNRRELVGKGELGMPGDRWVESLKLKHVTDAEFKAAIPEATDSYIAFRPTQIKSATGNVGSFDPNNPNITLKAK